MKSTTVRPVRLAAVAAVAALGLVLAACSSSSSSTPSSGGSSAPASGSTLTVADVAPFSGPDAALGPTYLATCYGATSAINAAGGVLGHKLSCKSVDTRGDPADAVPAVNQMFASTPNLALVIGCTSDEAAAVAPIINDHKMAMFCMTGQSQFDAGAHCPTSSAWSHPTWKSPTRWWSSPRSCITRRSRWRSATISGHRPSCSPAVGSVRKAGMTLTTNQTLDLKATTFRTEAAAIVQSHPDAIMTEALGAADPTLFSEIKQLNGGKMIPIIGTSAAISPAFFKSSAAAVGAQDFSSNFHADNLVVETSGPAYDAFKSALLSQQGKVPGTTGNFTTYLSAPGGVHLYDGINLAALAMIMSKSTSPSVYSPDIVKIGNGVPGATVCYSFTACASLLKSGKSIRYEGPGGPTNFDSHHDSTGIFQIDTYSPDGTVNVVGNITADLEGLTVTGAVLTPAAQGSSRARACRGAPACGGWCPVSLFLASIGFGLVTASVLAIASVGFTLQFAVTDVLNLAFGAVMIFSAFVAYLVNENGISVWIGLVAAMVAGSVVSVLLNSIVYTPFQRRGASPITLVIVSLGMTLIIEFSVQSLAGGDLRVLRHGQRPDLRRGRPDPHPRPGRYHGPVGAGHARGARAAALHQARQGHAGYGRQPQPGPQLRHPDRPGDHADLGVHRRAVRAGRARSSPSTPAASTPRRPTCSWS